MPIMLQSNHAMFFDGVTDSVIIPQGSFSKIGRDNAAGERNVSDVIGESRGPSLIGDGFGKTIAIEAWVMPDCGGVIVSKGNQFSLSIGTVDTPGPAVFVANVQTDVGLKRVALETATPTSNGYSGTVYPSSTFDGFEDSYNRFDSSKDDATNLNKNQRPLLHVVATLFDGTARLYVNGELMAKQSFAADYELLD